MFRVLKDCAQETPREVSLEGFCAHNHGSWTWIVRIFCVIWPFLRSVSWGGVGGQNFRANPTPFCVMASSVLTHMFFIL